MPRSRPRGPADTARRAGPAAAAHPVGLWRAAAGVVVAGLAVSGYLLLISARGAAPLCLVGSCAEVAASPYARFLGLPTAAWGLLLYLTAGVAVAPAVLRGAAASWLPSALFGLAVFGATFSAYLVWLQAAVLRAVCAWCAASAALWVVLLALSVAIVRRSP